MDIHVLISISHKIKILGNDLFADIKHKNIRFSSATIKYF